MQGFDDVLSTVTLIYAKKSEKQYCWVRKIIKKLKTASRVP